MNTCDDNDDVVDDDVTDNINDDIEDDEEESDEEKTHLETLTEEVVLEHEEVLKDYVAEPENPKQMTKNESIKKFLAVKVREKMLESFESYQQWLEDELLILILKKWKRAMAKDDELDGAIVTKKILRHEATIDDAVENEIEEQIDAEEQMDPEDTNE